MIPVNAIAGNAENGVDPPQISVSTRRSDAVLEAILRFLRKERKDAGSSWSPFSTERRDSGSIRKNDALDGRLRWFAVPRKGSEAEARNENEKERIDGAIPILALHFFTDLV